MLKVRYPMKSLLFENFSHDKAVWFFIVTMFNLHRLVHGWWWSQWCKPGACCKSHIRRSMWGLGGFRCTSSGSWSHPRWRYQRSNAFIKYQEMAKWRQIFHIVICPHMIFPKESSAPSAVLWNQQQDQVCWEFPREAPVGKFKISFLTPSSPVHWYLFKSWRFNS